MRAFHMTGLLAVLLLASVAMGQEPPPRLGVTIYSNADPLAFDPQQFIAQQRQGRDPAYAQQVPGFAVVRDLRELDLKQGVNRVSLTDVAQFIDPTTVMLTDLSAPADAPEQALRVVEQEFQFDLVSPQKLLEKYLDRQVTVHLDIGDGRRESVTGTLLSHTQGRLVLKTDAGVRMLAWTNDVQLGDLPGGLITKPTLQWSLWSPAAGKRQVRTAYQTSGLTWRADYNLVLSQDETKADLGAWVTILNLSGASYPDAQLKLIAGDVQRIQPPQMRQRLIERAGKAMDMAAPAGFEQKPFFEYHLYTLPRPASVVQNSTQQIALFPTVQGVNVEKVLVYYGLPEEARWWVFPNPATDRHLGQQSNKKVDVYVRFDNREDNRLGMPLPRGKMRVFKADAAAGQKVAGDGALEFVGEDLIDHTARNEQVLVKIGQSFDVTGERVQTDFREDLRARWIEETIRITMKNAKAQPQKVIVRENLYRWVNWDVVRKNMEYEKIDARTIHFTLEVPPEGSKTVEYTVRYSW